MNPKPPLPLFLWLAASSFALGLDPAPARADENMFGYSYGADTLPKGKFEIYNWTTWRHSKHGGEYDAFDIQFELEYGITDRFQTSTYLVLDARDQSGLGEDYEDLSRFRWDGVKQSFKYNVLSTYKDPVGLSLYIEPGYSRYHKVTGERLDEFELETKLILQKNFLEDTLIWALNVTPEFEWLFPEGDEDDEEEFILEVTSGLSYRFAPNWFAGLELRYHTEFPGYEFQEHQAVFLGPNLHYGGRKWWATLTVMPQIWGEPHERGANRHFGEHEALEVRVKLGYNF